VTIGRNVSSINADTQGHKQTLASTQNDCVKSLYFFLSIKIGYIDSCSASRRWGFWDCVVGGYTDSKTESRSSALT